MTYLILTTLWVGISSILLTNVAQRISRSVCDGVDCERRKRVESDLNTAIIWPALLFTIDGRSRIVNALS